MQAIKSVCVGDCQVGISNLLVTYTTDNFDKYPTEWIVTVMDTYSATATIGDDEQYNIQLFESSRMDEYEKLRLLMYPGTDVALLCFSVVRPTLFENIEERWMPEITRYCPPGCPYLLVGLQTDLRDDPSTVERLAQQNQKPVPPKRAEKLARRLNAVTYVECSAITKEGVQHVFDQLVLAARNGQSKTKEMHKCELL